MCDNQEILSRDINSIIDSMPSTRRCTRLQTAAYLLGAHKELPDVDDQGHVPTDYKGLEKVEFRIPLNTMDKNKSTTYVDHFYAESDLPLDILDSMRAAMDLPKTYENLGWRLSTACRVDPPHRLLTSQDISSTFKAAWAKQTSGWKKKKVAIEIVNTMPVLKRSRLNDKQYNTRDPNNACITLPSTPHFHDICKTLIVHFLNSEVMILYLLNHSRGHLLSTWRAMKKKRMVKPPQDIDKVLASIHSCYPGYGVPQYAATLKEPGILYLQTAQHILVVNLHREGWDVGGAVLHFTAVFVNGSMKEERVKARREEKGKTKDKLTTPSNENSQLSSRVTMAILYMDILDKTDMISIVPLFHAGIVTHLINVSGRNSFEALRTTWRLPISSESSKASQDSEPDNPGTQAWYHHVMAVGDSQHTTWTHLNWTPASFASDYHC
ncbi:hypothetical protein DFJ58DRAFT_843209 [Suillus subalutaceus]|uniref:uncharacterized protein n=1 Tax=Suillus subalutaceus TaxID=48586 RepID=UPI001B8719AA|nr:uncharacterized protein DFJ58DRAFT_843209 [Suillus subalutaceus]KAG1847311.1 hypothetical protein DFJ58DRAFT_843209 [Suillus subalutaceus]